MADSHSQHSDEILISYLPKKPDAMMYVVLRKVSVALGSSFLLCLLMALIYYIPESEQKAGSLYWSFSSLMIIYLIYSVPVFLVGGILFSVPIDQLFDKSKIQFSIKSFSYSS